MARNVTKKKCITNFILSHLINGKNRQINNHYCVHLSLFNEKNLYLIMLFNKNFIIDRSKTQKHFLI